MLAKQLKELIIEPVLKNVATLYSLSAVNLLLGTAAVESNLGEYIEQVPCGTAKGIYQIEMRTHDDVIRRLEDRAKSNLLLAVKSLKISHLTNEQNLIGNLYYSTIIARLIYYLIPIRLPAYNDIEGLAAYWKKYYNTPLGKGKTEDFIKKYNDLVKIC